MKATLPELLSNKNLQEIQNSLSNTAVVTRPDGARYYKTAIGQTDCVRYTQTGIEYFPDGREIKPPAENEVLIMPTSVSLCGTDLGLIEKARAGQLPPETAGKVVGHEASGFIVGLGSKVTNWKLGQFVCLESHYACGRPGHQSFDDCVMSGLSCDGIAGGIRGSLSKDGVRQETYNGYWSRLLAIPQSALPVELPLEIAENLKAPSTLESLGNLYMIEGQLEKIGLTKEPEKTLLVVSGLGATGYPMACVAKHYNFYVVGINPSIGKRDFAKKQRAVDVAYQTLEEVEPHLSQFENIAIVVTADHPSAHEDAIAFLETKASSKKRKVAILFGLYADPTQPIAGAPTEFAQMPQRDFVFSRHSYTSESRVEVYGVCGRDLKSWQTLMKDLRPIDNKVPELVTMLNQAQLQIAGDNPLKNIAEALNQGANHIDQMLKEHNALKLVANFLKP